MTIGATLQKIRKNLHFTQQELSQGIMSQGAYSKIEQSQLQINAEQLLALLSKMNIHLNEFSFVMNHYQADDKQKILRNFIAFEIGDISLLQAHLHQIEHYLSTEADPFVESLRQIYQAFLVLLQEQNIQKAREIIWPIWENMQRLDHWYIHHLEVLNAILFLFPLDVAQEITNTALKRLANYDHYEQDFTYLKIYFRMDLSVLYIEHQQFEECLHLLESLETEYIQKMRYQSLALLFERKAICYYFLQKPYEAELAKMKQLLTIYQDERTSDLLLMEFKLLTKNEAVDC
ncbi:helix-turn-helix domain-containing protein [Lysinibacillus piscis]|uniref:HTH cro/C1-type domain-containing protein n=1 Tax=Lysinibacillus piscis TaxID=2518931 RepID=A0ABQ5NIW6_9BACI|nr:helix-turn-helix transcriptional regulator [Lysinibacillus sp. KH24]GLC87964.1 hypothetical protein LYSBPC_10910 [Lysinibacillus sp. KH24]